jgi:hypothetical protein
MDSALHDFFELDEVMPQRRLRHALDLFLTVLRIHQLFFGASRMAET